MYSNKNMSNCNKPDLKIIGENINPKNTKNNVNVHKNSFEEYKSKNINITKKNNVNVNLHNSNDDLIKQIKLYADKINKCDILGDISLSDFEKIKKAIHDINDTKKHLILDYHSLLDFNDSLTEIIDFFQVVNKEITNHYYINDEKILNEVLLTFKKIYSLLNVFENFKINITTNNQININTSISELNSILDSMHVKIGDINNKISNFINSDSCKEYDNAIKFINNSNYHNGIEHTIDNIVDDLNNQIIAFDNQCAKLNNTLLLLKNKIKNKN